MDVKDLLRRPLRSLDRREREHIPRQRAVRREHAHGVPGVEATVVERYDTWPLMGPDDISRRWNNHKWYIDNAQTLGKLLLTARRLCETGCGFITVTTGFVWDMHSDQNNAGVEEGMQYMGVPFDHAISTFLRITEDSMPTCYLRYFA